jgi:imidazolonepropionase-like amidohydrolase
MRARILRGVVALVFTGAALAGCLHLHPAVGTVERVAAPATVVFRDVTVFDGKDLVPRRHRDVWVRHGRIAAETATGAREVGDASVIEGKGRTLMPGLVDAHAHTTLTGAPPWYTTLPDAERNLEAHLFAGVTSVLDLAGMPREIEKARAGIASGWPAPDVLFAGPMMTVENGYPRSYAELLFPWPIGPLIAEQLAVVVEDAGAARQAVKENEAAGNTLVKAVVASTPLGAPRMSSVALHALVEEAHRRHRLVFAHIESPDHALEAAEAGVDVLAHGVHTGPLDDAQLARLAATDVKVVPTLLSLERLHQLIVGEVAFSATERAIEPEALLASFDKSAIDAYDAPEDLRRWLEHLEAHREQAQANVKRLHDAGVPLLVGTDANGSPGCFPGGIHREMELLVAAGLPAAEVLSAATWGGAQLIASTPDTGRIASGYRADLLLVEGEPFARITDSAAVALIMKAGRVYERRVKIGASRFVALPASAGGR